MIRKAEIIDLMKIKKITEACTQDLIDQNIFQWNKNYPGLTAFKEDIQQLAMH